LILYELRGKLRGEFAKCFSSLILNVSSLTISLRDSGSIQNALRPTLYLLRSSTRPPRLSLFTASSPDHLFKLSSPLHPILSKKGCNPPHTTTHTPISLYKFSSKFFRLDFYRSLLVPFTFPRSTTWILRSKLRAPTTRGVQIE